MSNADGGHGAIYASPDHDVKEWLADGSKLVVRELTMAIDRLTVEL